MKKKMKAPEETPSIQKKDKPQKAANAGYSQAKTKAEANPGKPAAEFKNDAKIAATEAQSAGLKAKTDGIVKIMGMLTDRVNSIQKDLAEIKAKKAPATGNMPDILERMKKTEKDIPGLKERIEETEEAIDKLTDMMKSAPASKGSELKGDAKALMAKIASLENSRKETQEIMKKFNEKITSLQKGLAEAGKSSRPEAKPGEIAELKASIEEMEDILEKITQKMKSAPAPVPSAPPVPPELRDVRPLMDRVSRMESAIKDMRERLASMDEDIAKAAGQNSQARPEPQIQQEPPADITPLKERLDSLDMRITGINDKLMQLSGDAQKLSDYFMEGMKHLEEKLQATRKMVSAENRMLSSADSMPVTLFRPTTYRSHLRQPVPEPAPDNDIPDDYETIPRQALPMPMPPPRPAQVAQIPEESLPAPFPGNLPPPPSPDRGSMFTKLREGTVKRRPMDPDMQDIEIITEHIWESMRRRESREKITRDLINTGFEKELIDKAFMQARVG
jgi:predicted  nucleic acid-binding Zn-ribbon protein